MFGKFKSCSDFKCHMLIFLLMVFIFGYGFALVDWVLCVRAVSALKYKLCILDWSVCVPKDRNWLYHYLKNRAFSGSVPSFFHGSSNLVHKCFIMKQRYKQYL